MLHSPVIDVIIDNPPAGDPTKHRHELLHRIFANGLIRIETPETLTVPRSAVLATGAEPLVYVVKAGRGVRAARGETRARG